MKITKSILAILFVALFFASCSQDDDNVAPRGAYDDGVLIVNEGGFFNGNASVTFVSEDLTTVEQNIFSNVNNTPLGDIAQSIGFYNNLAYIVVNNSHKVEVVDRYTFESVATIDTDLMNPRYITFSGNKGYVTNWGDGSSATDDFVAVIDLNNNSVQSTIAVAEGPEKILERNGKLYVAHKGGFSQGNSISVISLDTNNITTITTGDVPDEIVFDGNTLWVLCEGNPSWTGNETAGSIVTIDATTDTVANTLTFGTTEHPSILDIENNTVYYYMSGSVYSMATSSIALPTTATLSNINTNAFSASMKVNGNTLYFTDAGDNASAGSLLIYNLNDNTLTDTKTVGINPGGGIYFNVF